MTATRSSPKTESPAKTADEPTFLRRGKVKEVYSVSPKELEFRFSDDISVFDKKIPTPIPHKGETLCRTSAHWFELCTRIGVNHHFLRLSAPDRMRVRRVEVVPKVKGDHPKNTFIPLEFVVRYYVAGSLWDRLKSGKVKPSALGFPSGHTAAYGQALPEPMFEVTTKLEEVDRLLTEKEAMEIGGLSPAALAEVRETIFKIDKGIEAEIKPRGLLHVDGKKEFGYDEAGKLMVVDTFGTGDEDRFWEIAGVERGRFEEFSKEFVRQHYRQVGYYAKLSAAREAHTAEPAIPPLPPQLVDEVSRLYTSIFERLTGQPFRSQRAA